MPVFPLVGSTIVPPGFRRLSAPRPRSWRLRCVLDGPAGVQELALREDERLVAFRDAVQTDQRRITDCLQDVCADVHVWTTGGGDLSVAAFLPS